MGVSLVLSTFLWKPLTRPRSLVPTPAEVNTAQSGSIGLETRGASQGRIFLFGTVRPLHHC